MVTLAWSSLAQQTPPTEAQTVAPSPFGWEDIESTSRNRHKGLVEASLADETLARWNLGGCGNERCKSGQPGFHPATRVVVEIPALGSAQLTLAARTTLNKYVAEFRNHGYWPFRACYEAAARENGSRGGDTRIRVRLGRKGQISQIDLVGTTTDHHSIASCIVGAAQTITLPPSNKRLSSFLVRVRLFPGDAPLEPQKLSSDSSERLDLTRYRPQLESLRKSIEDCADRALKRDPKLWGRIAMSIHIDGQGRVADFTEIDSHFPDSATLECARDAAYQYSFPSPPSARLIQLAIRVGQLLPNASASSRPSSSDE